MEENQVLLECRGIYKSFGKNKVLQDINLRVRKGEVHALLGQNGGGEINIGKDYYRRVFHECRGNIHGRRASSDKFSRRVRKMREYQLFIRISKLVPFFDVTMECVPGLGDQRKRRGNLNFKKMKELVDEKLKA